MKPGLERIEATLQNIDTTDGSEFGAESVDAPKRSYSFTISIPNRERGDETQSNDAASGEQESTLLSQSSFVQTFPAHESGQKSPSLPKLKTPSFTSHRNVPNPALAMSLLQEIQTQVASWQVELQQILRQIQDIYAEGPIVDGWLESHPLSPEVKDGALSTRRHAEVDHLRDYVEEMSDVEGNVSYQSPRSGYRLCGLDAAGKMWSRPCPPEQVPSISVAIARYQKLRQLLGRKQYLEKRLSQLAETLVVLHSHM